MALSVSTEVICWIDLEDEVEWKVNRDELAYITLHVSRLSADLSATRATRLG